MLSQACRVSLAKKHFFSDRAQIFFGRVSSNFPTFFVGFFIIIPLTYPASTSGHLIPRAYLNNIGLNPDNAFKETIFAGSHAASILSVTSGKIDVGCTNLDLSLDKMIREGDVKKEEVVILWTSPPIVNDAIAVRTDLNKDFVKKLQNAFIDVAREDYPAFDKYTRLYFPNTKKMSYIPIEDSIYNGLRTIAGKIKQFKIN